MIAIPVCPPPMVAGIFTMIGMRSPPDSSGNAGYWNTDIHSAHYDDPVCELSVACQHYPPQWCWISDVWRMAKRSLVTAKALRCSP
jgi:hypothetical protein